jgi:hypothetical protein
MLVEGWALMSKTLTKQSALYAPVNQEANPWLAVNIGKVRFNH